MVGACLESSVYKYKENPESQSEDEFGVYDDDNGFNSLDIFEKFTPERGKVIKLTFDFTSTPK